MYIKHTIYFKNGSVYKNISVWTNLPESVVSGCLVKQWKGARLSMHQQVQYGLLN